MKSFITLIIILGSTISCHGQEYKTGNRVEANWRGTWYKASILEVKGDSYKIRYDGYDSSDEWVKANQLRSSNIKTLTKHPPGLVNSRWKQISVTLPNGEVKNNGSYVGLSIYSKSNKWDITTTISYGSGVQIIARGIYKLSGNKLSLINQDGTSYGNFVVALNDGEMVLTRVNGKGTERYTYGGMLQSN